MVNIFFINNNYIATGLSFLKDYVENFLKLKFNTLTQSLDLFQN